AAPSAAEAMRQVSTGEADAVALSEDYLRMVQPEVPGSHLLAEAFQETSVSVAVPKGRPDALAFVGAFVERAKQSGLLRGIFDR
ncbi:transporter substrate-binding domain-containing protein, partial [Klebsiella pneumoniae]|nr:transporter substrate-binding domain-containing protein [Klebsiella pneumoniae]